MRAVESFKDLRVWQAGIELADAVYEATAVFPAHERFGLSRQMQKAAISVPSNVAEGFARHGSGELAHFLSYARGSLAELVTQIEIATRRGYLDTKTRTELDDRCESLGRQLTKFRQAAASRASAPNP